MEMVQAGLGFLAAADATAMPAETQAWCLQMLERANSISTAARTSVLAAFTSGQGYSADADYSPRAWLVNRTRVTKGAAVGYTAWVRRAATHPEVAAVLASGEMSESFARTICAWTDKLPQECRPDADEILLGAAGNGMGLRDLAGLAGEIYARSLPGRPDEDRDEAFEDRPSVRLETTFEGAGVLHGDLTPECASVVVIGAGRAGGAGGGGGHPQPGAAVPRRPAGGDAAARRGRAAARAGRAAGQGVGAPVAGGPDGAGRQLGAAGGVDRGGPCP